MRRTAKHKPSRRAGAQESRNRRESTKMKFIINYTNIKSGVKHSTPLSKTALEILKAYNDIIWHIDSLKAVKGSRVVGEIKA
jgi:hypothetical protein